MRRLILSLLLVCLSALPALAAVGDTVADCSSVSASSTVDVQPGAGVEWAIRYIWFEDNVELQRYDGTDLAIVAQFIGPNYQYFSPPTAVTNGNRIRIKNLNGSTAKVICYEGTITK